MLPIHAVLPDLLAVLSDRSSAVLVAPPGAGKTTAVAPALLNQSWCTGEILLLSPRRLAARAAAERIADLLGEKTGGFVGYATRLDSKRSAATRILVATQGIFANRIQAEPDLPGVSAVLFDEVHERSLDSDLGLALALDSQAALRLDLRLIAMSATLDGARFSKLMGDAPVIESEGKSWPLTLRHTGRNPSARIEDDMAATIRRALTEDEGDLLAFLPGVREIERTAERIEGLLVEVHPLHGSLDPVAQRAAIRPSSTGQRKVILSTSIAETSLTIDGVRITVDSGLARRPRHDRAAGVTRLVTERVSQAAAIQRAGRAARQGPGVAWRLWEEAATKGLPPFDPPEILNSDLTGLALDLALWGVGDVAQLRWLDPPPAASLAEAKKALEAMGALDGDGHVTAHGKAMVRIPLPPNLAHMLVLGRDRGMGLLAAELAVLLTERGLGGRDMDLELRLRRWRGDRSDRARAARRLAERLAGPSEGAAGEEDIASLIALAFPDRIAKRRDASGENWISVGGRGLRLDPASPLARSEWLAIADLQGEAAGARITAAAAIDTASVEALFGDRIKTRTPATYDPATRRVEAMRETLLGAVRLSRANDDRPDAEAIAAALLEAVRRHGLAILPWSNGARRLRDRARFAGVEALNDASLLEQLDLWLASILSGKRSLDALDPGDLTNALRRLLDWDQLKTINRLAPEDFTSPAGTSHAIDYDAPGGPTVELRVQALYGLAEHPCVGEARTPLLLSLTSPAGRPIQTTSDLPGFWKGSWADVAKEMRGRYPKHDWPADPANARPSLKTKKAAKVISSGMEHPTPRKSR